MRCPTVAENMNNVVVFTKKLDKYKQWTTACNNKNLRILSNYRHIISKLHSNILGHKSFCLQKRTYTLGEKCCCWINFWWPIANQCSTTVPSSNGSVTYPPTGIRLAQLGVLPELGGILRTKEAKKHKGIINKNYYYVLDYILLHGLLFKWAFSLAPKSFWLLWRLGLSE